MTNFANPTALQHARDLTSARLHQYPGHPLFTFAKMEIDRITEALRPENKIDLELYNNLKIGLMCALELETTDMTFCDAVYVMLDEIRPSA